MTNDFAVREQARRDLREQLAEVTSEDRKDIEFLEFSPGRKLVSLWSMQDGVKIEIPQYMVPAALGKRFRGRYRFTAHEHEAPPVREGKVKCFLAEDSPERLSGLLDEAGLGHIDFCPAEHLQTEYSKRVHAQNRHIQSWPMLQEYLNKKDSEEYRDEQRQQTAAILGLVNKQAGGPTESPKAAMAETYLPQAEALVCEDCGWASKPDSKNPIASLNTHKRLHCPARKQE